VASDSDDAGDERGRSERQQGVETAAVT